MVPSVLFAGFFSSSAFILPYHKRKKKDVAKHFVLTFYSQADLF